MAHVTQILNDALPLQMTGRTNRQNTFRIPSPSFALCAEAAFTPQYTLTHETISGIVGRLYIRVMHKGPQIPLVTQDIAALTAQIAVKASPDLLGIGMMISVFIHSIRRKPAGTQITPQSR